MSAPAMMCRGILEVKLTPGAPRDSLNKPADLASRNASDKRNSTERRGWGIADLP
jgi:hypothetical protein